MAGVPAAAVSWAAMARVVFLLTAVAALLAAGCGSKGSPGELRAAGASDLVYAMEEIIPKFEAATGKRVTFVPGSSGQLAAQIGEGAPYDVFFSANVAFADDAVASGYCDGGSKRLYARGRIAMWAGADGRPELPAAIAGLADPRYQRIAIANPAHAPYGVAAVQALQGAGVHDAVAARIVHGQNVKETMSLAETDNADVAIIALSLVAKTDGPHVVIPENLHAPIDQAMVVCTSGKATALAREFAAFMATPEARTILASYGFAVPQ
jgi:molybdate transport system substrate-binding protein